ncbi:50S ribosomal protein L14 [Candidatus Dojkabacteria bacterium]|uniref:Large ribosomal subunit protein uL14 n=1 Tax=Candidatus Dojkabacteria bacterium TaxID=2099670 RepID=A0A955L7I7_9BACT|nr:50S ribosomal protein L14 [Candidatus Dojkabacteria bacterium]
MVQSLSRLKVADNSGAKELMVIAVLGKKKGGSFQRTGTVGEIVTASIKKVIPNSAFKQGDVVRAVIVRTSKEVRRKDGSYIRFDDNAAVIIDKEKKDPKATRVFGPIARELKDKGFNKIVSLASEVL